MLTRLRRLFRLTTTTIVLLIVCFGLSFSLLTFAIAPLANLMLAAANRLAVQPAVVATTDLATVKGREKKAQRRAAKLEAERVADRTRLESSRLELEKVQADLDNERRKAARYANELTASKLRLETATNELSQSRKRALRLTGELEDLRETPLLTHRAIDKLTARIVKRTGVNAARNLASIPLESVPVVGALTIVSVTALEIHDACQTAAEMGELRQLANLPDVDASVIREACAKIPTFAGLDDLTLTECRNHENEVLTELGPEAAAPIKKKCDCLELPDGCPDDKTLTVRVPSPPSDLP